MENLDHFLSPEAVSFLDTDKAVNAPLYWERPVIDACSISKNYRPTRMKREASARSVRLPGTSTLHGACGSRPNPRRSRFDDNRRREVAIIRKRGACFRCRLMKIAVSLAARETKFAYKANALQCSGDVPCRACSQIQRFCQNREPKYKWMHCVAYSLKDLDVYALGEQGVQSPEALK